MGQRSARGRGSIEELPSGSFRVVVRAGKDPITGKYAKLAETYPTRDEASRALDRLVALVEADQAPDRAATVSVLMKRWLEVADLELSTLETTEGYIRRTIEPALGDVPLRKLQHRVDLLDRLYTHLRRCSQLCDGRAFVEHTSSAVHDCSAAKCRPHRCKPMSPSTVRRIHGILSPALGYAVSWGWIERNPAEYAHPPKLQRRRARPPQAEEVARLLNLAFEVDLEMGVFLWLATTTGARRGELVALRWPAVNLELAHIDIAHNYVVRNGQRRLKGTKTDSERRLSLDEVTRAMLADFREQREQALAPAGLSLPDDAFLFSADPRCERPWHPDHFTHLYRELAAEVGIAEPLKNLRHFNATQLLAAGVDLRTTAGRLGHGDGGATTLRVYASWTKPADRAAAEHLSSSLMTLRGGASSSPLGAQLRRVQVPAAAILSPAQVTNYRDIVAALHQTIENGRLANGDTVPTVVEIAEFYGVAKSTAQRAVSEIASSGALIRRGSRWVVS